MPRCPSLSEFSKIRNQVSFNVAGDEKKAHSSDPPLGRRAVAAIITIVLVNVNGFVRYVHRKNGPVASWKFAE